MKPFKNSRSFFPAFFVLTLIACLLLQTGCAILNLNGMRQDIEVTSTPSDAKIFVNGAQQATTPGVITVKRRGAYILRFEREGYKPVEMEMKREMSGWVLSDLAMVVYVVGVSANSSRRLGRAARLGYAAMAAILFPGIDFLTGAAYKQVPATLHVELPRDNRKR